MLLDYLTIDVLNKLRPLRAVFAILCHCVECTEEVMTWKWGGTASP